MKNQSNMILEVEFLDGTDIEDAILEAREKASIFNLAYVKFRFHGVTLNIHQTSDVELTVHDYQIALKAPEGHKLVIGRRK